MKKLLPFMGFMVLLGMSANSQAFFGGSDYYDCPPWEYDCNPYDEWDPRYWNRPSTMTMTIIVTVAAPGAA